MTIDLDSETVAERCEAACRERMALLHRTPLTWETRALRSDLAVEVEVLLDQWNLLTLGR